MSKLKSGDDLIRGWATAGEERDRWKERQKQLHDARADVYRDMKTLDHPPEELERRLARIDAEMAEAGVQEGDPRDGR